MMNRVGVLKPESPCALGSERGRGLADRDAPRRVPTDNTLSELILHYKHHSRILDNF